jgi:hypothetical protein
MTSRNRPTVAPGGVDNGKAKVPGCCIALAVWLSRPVFELVFGLLPNCVLVYVLLLSSFKGIAECCAKAC